MTALQGCFLLNFSSSGRNNNCGPLDFFFFTLYIVDPTLTNHQLHPPTNLSALPRLSPASETLCLHLKNKNKKKQSNSLQWTAIRLLSFSWPGHQVGEMLSVDLRAILFPRNARAIKHPLACRYYFHLIPIVTLCHHQPASQ